MVGVLHQARRPKGGTSDRLFPFFLFSLAVLIDSYSICSKRWPRHRLSCPGRNVDRRWKSDTCSKISSNFKVKGNK
ncbi:hypothetical protein BCV70DRAFT_89868 [Testicularia cyperi]|uniref:Uncharacterized protein n=1 Tax=Testicularia cyperi TaxID=1882483 RepID=A0A317XTA1_9BASI|nr:hypothetical protein BCV70DRAFT_89868 [Testicularia cyperi]